MKKMKMADNLDNLDADINLLLGKIEGDNDEPPPPPQLLEALTLDEFLEVQRRLQIIEQQVFKINEDLSIILSFIRAFLFS